MDKNLGQARETLRSATSGTKQCHQKGSGGGGGGGGNSVSLPPASSVRALQTVVDSFKQDTVLQWNLQIAPMAIHKMVQNRPLYRHLSQQIVS